jgi:hypothetical protein
MTTFDQRHGARGETPPNPYLPDLGFSGNDWSWEDDDTDDMEPDEDETPGVMVVLALLIGLAALVALVLGVALLLAPLITVR